MGTAIIAPFFLFVLAGIAQAIEYSITCTDAVVPMIRDVRGTHIEETIRRMSGFKTRLYDSPEALASQEAIAEQWRGFAEGRDDVRVEFVHHDWPDHLKPGPGESRMPSVVLTVEGSESPHEIVVVGAHGDSIAFGSDYDGRIVATRYFKNDPESVLRIVRTISPSYVPTKMR